MINAGQITMFVCSELARDSQSEGWPSAQQNQKLNAVASGVASSRSSMKSTYRKVGSAT